MALHLRGVFFGQRQHTQIGDDKGIHTGLGGILYILRQLGQFLIGRQGVKGQIDLFAAGMGKDAALAQLPYRQVYRGRAHTKFRQGAVNGVSAVHHSIFQGLQAARRGQQFRLLQH